MTGAVCVKKLISKDNCWGAKIIKLLRWCLRSKWKKWGKCCFVTTQTIVVWNVSWVDTQRATTSDFCRKFKIFITILNQFFPLTFSRCVILSLIFHSNCVCALERFNRWNIITKTGNKIKQIITFVRHTCAISLPYRRQWNWINFFLHFFFSSCFAKSYQKCST